MSKCSLLYPLKENSAPVTQFLGQKGRKNDRNENAKLGNTYKMFKYKTIKAEGKFKRKKTRNS